jgi:hypothetical protein
MAWACAAVTDADFVAQIVESGGQSRGTAGDREPRRSGLGMTGGGRGGAVQLSSRCGSMHRLMGDLEHDLGRGLNQLLGRRLRSKATVPRSNAGPFAALLEVKSVEVVWRRHVDATCSSCK